MPRRSVWFLRASLLYLAAGCILGSLMLAQKAFPHYVSIWLVLPVHVEFLLVGWLVQLAMGVAFWILPRFGTGAPRGREDLVRLSFFTINAGVLMVVLQYWVPGAWLAGRAAELAAVLLYVIGTWRRVKPSPGATGIPAQPRPGSL